jgi:hypothetical protein
MSDVGSPVYFVVERTIAGEQPAIYRDHLPDRLTGKNAKRDGLVYAVRMDTLPHGEKWMAMSLSELYEAFRKAQAGNIPLPQNIASPPSETKPAERKMGHRERFAQHPGSHLPAEPFPTVEELDRRAEARPLPAPSTDSDCVCMARVVA